MILCYDVKCQKMKPGEAKQNMKTCNIMCDWFLRVKRTIQTPYATIHAMQDDLHGLGHQSCHQDKGSVQALWGMPRQMQCAQQIASEWVASNDTGLWHDTLQWNKHEPTCKTNQLKNITHMLDRIQFSRRILPDLETIKLEPTLNKPFSTFLATLPVLWRSRVNVGGCPVVPRNTLLLFIL